MGEVRVGGRVTHARYGAGRYVEEGAPQGTDVRGRGKAFRVAVVEFDAEAPQRRNVPLSELTPE